MLTLTRKELETVILTCDDGTRIVVQVVEIAGGRIKLGFEAPLSVQITRAELEGKKGGKQCKPR